jgi:hypothetical protein
VGGEKKKSLQDDDFFSERAKKPKKTNHHFSSIFIYEPPLVPVRKPPQNSRVVAEFDGVLIVVRCHPSLSQKPVRTGILINKANTGM